MSSRLLSYPLLAAIFTFSTLATSVHAGIVVSSYSMPDGADLHDAYFDNLYDGDIDSNRFLSGGTGELTDGVLTATVTAGYGAWAPYVLWDATSPKITFDLGGLYALTDVTAYFKYYPQAAVYIPASVSLRFSSDGVSFGSAQQRLFDNAERVPGGNDSDGIYQLLVGSVSAQFVELTLNNGPENRWLALSEVVFDGAPTAAMNNVPEPGTGALLFGAAIALGLLRTRPQASEQ
jgi:hypothetical protein